MGSAVPLRSNFAPFRFAVLRADAPADADFYAKIDEFAMVPTQAEGNLRSAELVSRTEEPVVQAALCRIKAHDGSGLNDRSAWRQQSASSPRHVRRGMPMQAAVKETFESLEQFAITRLSPWSR